MFGYELEVAPIHDLSSVLVIYGAFVDVVDRINPAEDKRAAVRPPSPYGLRRNASWLIRGHLAIAAADQDRTHHNWYEYDTSLHRLNVRFRPQGGSL